MFLITVLLGVVRGDIILKILSTTKERTKRGFRGNIDYTFNRNTL